MRTVPQAQEIILQHVQRLNAESVPIERVLGRVLAEDVVSNRNHPPYDISAMDGYAIRFADVKGATKDNPVTLNVVDDIRAGVTPKCPVCAGEASMIMTGAPIPRESDAVIRVEDTSRRSHKGRHSKQEHPEAVDIWAEVPSGNNIRLMGENLKLGDTVLNEGAVIRPAEVGVLSMVKKAQVSVWCQPTVAILATGDELETLNEPLNPEKIADSNTYSTMAQIQALGIEPVLLGIARDTREHLEEKLRQGLQYDVLIVTGGVSVGHHDFVRPTLQDLGITMHFWRVAMRPGHPMAFGTGSKTKVFALPGNPVAGMVCCEQFIIPAMRKMMGFDQLYRPTVEASVVSDVKDRAGRMHFMRARLSGKENNLQVESVGAQGSGILMSMVRANALMVVPAECDYLQAGDRVRVQLPDSDQFQAEPGLEVY
ncbi:MAG: molybdopterin molybdotransferase MoeA [Gammaproteobacteria bacterium]|nr:MAG: molybdopterin molybdotransferase MoeA [Gammaproteobacteria bacterium]